MTQAQWQVSARVQLLSGVSGSDWVLVLADSSREAEVKGRAYIESHWADRADVTLSEVRVSRVTRVAP